MGSSPSFDVKLQKEEEVLDALVQSLARGQLDAQAWARLHLAAVRDERVSELAFAYESYAQGRRFKTFPAAVQAEVLFKAATFFADTLGDELGARSYLERALVAVPGHPGAFERLDQLLTKAGEHKKRAEAYVAVAQHRPRTEQIELLRKAASLVEGGEGGDERSIEIHQQLLRLDAGDAKARAALEEKYLRANRHRDVARLLEHALSAESAPPSPEDARAMRSRLIELYGAQLHEPERTIPHVEALLAVDPTNDEARKAAVRLIAIKGLAARAAAALADAHAAVGTPGEVARYLAIELEHTRGPKRREVLTRLGTLKQDRLNDPAGAFEAFEQALLLDPSEDDLRVRYVTSSLRLGKALDAARTLSRVGPVAKDARVRARISAETGELLAAGGDVRRARATFVSVLATPAADSIAVLKAARALSEIYASEKDSRALADVLEKIAATETEPEKKRRAIEQLGELASHTLKDAPRAIAAWKRLVDGPSRGRALSELESLYEAASTATDLAWVLEERAGDARGADARVLLVRAAEVLTRAGDGERASAAWKRVVDKFGASRDVNAQRIPLLEARREWAELAEALAADAQLAPESERAAIWARLGHVHVQRTKQLEAAIDAFKRALGIQPTEKTSRAALEKLLASNEHGLAAASVLEPLHRAEDARGDALLRALEVRAQLDLDGKSRLAALAEATDIAAHSKSNVAKAIELAARGLKDAIAQEAPLAKWLARLDVLAEGVDAKRLASLLSQAIGDRAVTTLELSALTRRIGEAHAASGDAAGAIAAFRRALDFEPNSGDLLARIDELLRDQGNAAERVALYRATLARGGVAPQRRRELLHAIGALARDELHDPVAATESYRAALSDDADDRDAHAALVDLFNATSQWNELGELLETRLARASGAEAIAVRAQLAVLAATHGQVERARAHARALLAEPGLPMPALDVVEHVAAEIDDTALLRAVLERRADESEDAREQVQWLTRLGILEYERAEDAGAGIAAWKRAAALARSSGDDAVARDLYERVREVSPLDRDATQRLAELLEAAEAWARLPELYDVLAKTTTDTSEQVAILMKQAQLNADKLADMRAAASSAERAFAVAPRDGEVLAAYERYAIAARETASFAKAVEAAMASAVDAPESATLRDTMAFARARTLATDPATYEEAIRAYMALLGSATLDADRAQSAAQALESLLGAAEPPARAQDWRWLLDWRVASATEADRVSALLAAAAIEESRLGAPARALALHREALKLDPNNVEALVATARIALATGDASGSVDALLARRDRSEGAARTTLELEIAGILLDHGMRRLDALRSIASVLEAAPGDRAALAMTERLLGHEETRDAAVAMLERTLDAADDAEVRAQVLVRLLDTPAKPSAADRRRQWFDRLLELQHERGAIEEALAACVRAAEELPTVDSFWERAEALARSLTRPDEVAALYTRVLASGLSREDALTLGRRAVAFHEEWFEDSDRVVRILERVLEIDPSEAWAFERLKLIFDAAGRWDDLFALCDRAIAAASGARRVELLEDSAQIAKDFANRSERAIGYLEQLNALKPTDAGLSAALERLYERHGRNRELVQLLHARVPRLSPRDAQATRARVTSILLNELGDAASALAVVEEIIARSAEGDAVLDVAALVERILAIAPPNAEVRDSIVPPNEDRPSRASVPPSGAKRTLVRHRAAALLKERYASAGREADLVRVLEIELETIRSAKERIRRHAQIADLHSSLGRDAEALEHAVSLVLLEPERVPHRERLAALAARVGRHDRLAEVLVTAADDCTDDALRIELLMQAGVVQADALEDDARAIDLFFRVLDIRGFDAAHLAAARRLAPLLERAERPYERLDTLERIAALEPDAAARGDVLRTIAAIATSLGESDRAIAAWQRRLADDASDADALAGLVALFEKERRWRPLIDVLDRRANLAPEESARRADRVRVAEILRCELGAIEDAVNAWTSIEQDFEATDESTNALGLLLRAAERWSELATILERAVARAKADARADLACELGDLRRGPLHDAPGAIRAYEEALALQPRHAAARAGLHAIVAGDSDRARAIEVLLSVYRAEGEWRAELGLLEARLSVAAGSDARVGVLREAAALAESRAEDREAAFRTMRRALLEDPAREELARELERLADATHTWTALADAYREALDAVDAAANAPTPAWSRRLRMALGDVLGARLDDPRGALQCYTRVLANAPTDSAAAHAAIREASRVARWDAIAKILVDAAAANDAVDAELVATIESSLSGTAAWDGLTNALAATLTEPSSSLVAEVARDLEARLGEWHRDRRSDPDAAESAFTRALTHTPDDPEILAALASLQRRTKGRPLVDSLLRLAGATGGDLDVLREAAEVARVSVGDRALARSIIERVLKLAIDQWVPVGDDAPTISSGPTAAPSAYVEWALSELARIHEEEGDLARIVELFVGASRLPFSRERSRAMRHDAATFALERVADVDRAVAIWRALFEEDRDDATAVARLVDVLERYGRREELLAVRREQVTTSTGSMRVAVRLEAARLEAALGERDAAIASLRANLEEDTRHDASLKELVALLEAGSRDAELVTLLARQAQREEDASEARAAADLWARAAEVAESRLGDADQAITSHRRVIRLEPRARSLDALARLLVTRDGWGEAATLLAQLLEGCEAEERAPVSLRLAEALVASGDDDAARVRLEEAAARDPSASEVIARLGETYRAKREWRPLAELLTRSASHAKDKATRLAALREAAELYRRDCDAPGAAVPLLEQASDLDPNDRELRLALADALGATQRFGDARSVLRALVEGFGGRRPKERAPVHYQLARLDLAMGDRAQALVELDTATRIDPANPEILHALAELARDDAQLERAERSYRALLAVLRRNEEPSEDAPIVRSEILVELAALARAAKENERAEELVESALEIATKSRVEARRLERALRARGEHATLARALEARIERGGEPEEVAEALAELATVEDETLGRPERALAARMRAISLAPHVPSLHAPAVDLARRSGALRTYVEALDALGIDAEARNDDDLACDLALRTGAIFEHDLGDDAGAARHYERAQRFHLRLPDVLRALDRIYERLGDVENQARVLAKRIDVESMSSAAAATTDALYRLARIKLVDPKTLDEGCDLLESALRIAPDFARAEGVLQAAADVHPQSERLVDIYESVGREPGHQRALVHALTLRAALPGNGSESLREAIEVARSFGDAALAESLLRKLIARARDDAAALTWALSALGELREAAGDVADAVALKRQAAELAEGDDARRLHFEVARLAKDRLHDLALAARVYRELHEREPVDRDAWEPLLEVYRLTGEHAERAELIARVVDFVDEPGERSKLRLERAKLVMTELGGRDEAAPMFREIVEDDPTQVEAAILLAEILEGSGRDEDLAELLSRQIDGAKDRSDAQSVAELSMRLGALVEKRDAMDARAVYYAALEWDASNRDVLRALIRLLASDDDAPDRADVMEKLLALEETEPAAALATSLADLRAKLGDEDGTRRALEAGFRTNPASATLRERLEKIYASNGEWASVASLYEAEAAVLVGKPERVARLREAATVWREMAGDPKRAADALRRARAEIPDDVTLLGELVEVLASSNDKAGAALELTLAIDWLGDDSALIAPLLVKRAELRDDLGDEDGALFDLEHAFRVAGAPYAQPIVEHLERVVSSALEEDDAPRGRAARLRLAEILPLANDPDRARALLAELLKHDPKDRDALRALARLEERAESWDAASSTYRRLVALEDGENVVDTALRLANACERANRLGDARGGLERARMVATTHEALTARLLALYEATGAFRELAALHLEEAKGARDVAGRFTHLLQAGTLMLEHGADPNAALVPLREANALRPGELACSARLAEGLAAIGKTQEAMELLGALLAPHKGRRSRELGLVHHALAHVARAAGDKKVEIASLTAALDMDPQSGAVASELALVAREAGQWELAQRALRAVTMLKTPAPLSRGLAYQYLGEIAQKQGDAKRAVMLLKRAVDDDPTLASARALLTQLKAAE